MLVKSDVNGALLWRQIMYKLVNIRNPAVYEFFKAHVQNLAFRAGKSS